MTSSEYHLPFTDDREVRTLSRPDTKVTDRFGRRLRYPAIQPLWLRWNVESATTRASAALGDGRPASSTWSMIAVRQWGSPPQAAVPADALSSDRTRMVALGRTGQASPAPAAPSPSWAAAKRLAVGRSVGRVRGLETVAVRAAGVRIPSAHRCVGTAHTRRTEEEEQEAVPTVHRGPVGV